MSDKTETRTASSTGGEKGVKLARYDLLPTGPLAEVASRFGLGAMKYENRNWERGYEWSKSYGALQRHLNAFWSGEEDDDLGEEAFRAAGLDPEDFKVDGRIPGSSHLAAAACHCLFLMEWLATHPEFDDRVSTERSRKANSLEDLKGITLEMKLPGLSQDFIELVFGGSLQMPEVKLGDRITLDDIQDLDDAEQARQKHRDMINDWHNRPQSDDIVQKSGVDDAPSFD